MQDLQLERRSGRDRRDMTLAAYWHGALRPRRRSGRRADDHHPVIDWHSPRVLAIVMTIIGLSVLDGVLTITLLSQGAEEANPLMALLLSRGLGWFATAKLALTTVGMFVLVACSRMRLFRTIRGETLLYAILACYLMLIVYELQLQRLIEARSAA